MKAVLIQKFGKYVAENNPDVMLGLLGKFSFTRFIEDQVEAVLPVAEHWAAEKAPDYIIEELCMEELTRPLKPSRFNYIKGLLEQEFSEKYWQFNKAGVLNYEVVNLIEKCAFLFEHFGFTEENEGDPKLQYAVTGVVSDYLEE